MQTPRKTVYYTDPLHDDFAGTRVKEPLSIDGDFPFVRRGPGWQLLTFLSRSVAFPLVWLGNRLWYGVRIRNRKALRGLKEGFFLYGNHTQAFPNATCPSLLAFPHRAYVLANPDAVSIPYLRNLVQMLGALPVPDTLAGQRAFIRALEELTRQRAVIAIYPEAHIWPYYVGVRPFPDASFAYPVRCGRPVVACAVTYRKRRLLRFLPPALTLTLSDPLFPDPEAPPGRERVRLHREVYRFLTEMSEHNEVEYIHYEQRKAE